MKETELRIGNYIEIKGKKSIVAGIKFDSVLHVELTEDIRQRKAEWTSFEIVSPIELTEELLLQLPEWFGKLIKEGFYNWSDGYDTRWIDVDYLHTAQNLYFALTGNELEVKF